MVKVIQTSQVIQIGPGTQWVSSTKQPTASWTSIQLARFGVKIPVAPSGGEGIIEACVSIGIDKGSSRSWSFQGNAYITGWACAENAGQENSRLWSYNSSFACTNLLGNDVDCITISTDAVEFDQCDYVVFSYGPTGTMSGISHVSGTYSISQR